VEDQVVVHQTEDQVVQAVPRHLVPVVAEAEADLQVLVVVEDQVVMVL
jgi:hypothetical protein